MLLGPIREGKAFLDQLSSGSSSIAPSSSSSIDQQLPVVPAELICHRQGTPEISYRLHSFLKYADFAHVVVQEVLNDRVLVKVLLAGEVES